MLYLAKKQILIAMINKQITLFNHIINLLIFSFH